MPFDQRIDHGPRSNDSNFGDFAAADVHWRGPAQEVLPFEVSVVETESQLQQVRALRQLAYGHHLPDLATRFGEPDEFDLRDDVVVFHAADKQTGRIVGTARLQTNRKTPLQVERSLQLPAPLRDRSLSEVTRLAVAPGYAPPVRQALVKAVQLWCIAFQVSGSIACSRRAMARCYEMLGFKDLFGDHRMVPLVHASGLPHRVLYGDQVTWEAESRARRSPHYDFFFTTYHPDIHIFRAAGHSGIGARTQLADQWRRAA